MLFKDYHKEQNPQPDGAVDFVIYLKKEIIIRMEVTL